MSSTNGFRPARDGAGLLTYLESKFASYSLADAVMLELESYLAWPFRNLPGLVGFGLRWLVYKILFAQLRSVCFIQPNVYFAHCRRIRCGSNFVVNSNTYINAVGGLSIGDNVLLGPNVVISSGQHPVRSAQHVVTLEKIVTKPIFLGDGVWIGANAVIMPGVSLGEGTVVGAGSIVTHSTAPFSVVAGVPARLLRTRLATDEPGSPPAV